MLENPMKMNRALGGEDRGGKSNEKQSISIQLNNSKIASALWGVSIESGAKELVKIFEIIENVKQNNFSAQQVNENLRTLFSISKVEIFKYNDIFSNAIINQIASAKAVNDISVELNGRSVKITGNSTTETVMQEWESKAKKQDPAKKLEQEKERMESVELAQVEADKMLLELDTLNFSDIEKCLTWLNNYEKYAGSYEVDSHKVEIIQKFEAHGYDREMNNITDFMIADALNEKDRKGKAMVAYMLVNMGLFRDIGSEIEIWKQSK